MLSLLRKILGRESYPLNKIYISKQHLVDNYKYLSGLNPNIKIAPVLKSNAYGHGIEPVGKIIDALNPPFICVDSIYEAYQLLKAGVKSEILIMGYIDPRSLKGKKLPFQYAVFDMDFAKALNRYQKGAKIHIFVGTGMSREGIRLSDLPNFLKQLKLLDQLNVIGLMSHFASSDNPKSKLNYIQLKNFNKAKQFCLKAGFSPKWFHMGGSMALVNGLTSGCNLIRCGRQLYGVYPDNNIHSALRLTSKIVQIKSINKGAKVGYSETYVAPENMTIAILPIGYYDGVDRRLSGNGIVRLKNTDCPIIGRISMNITTIDISNVLNPLVGDEVEIFSDNPEDKNSIQNCAKLCQTIPHDLLVHLNPATRRELV